MAEVFEFHKLPEWRSLFTTSQSAEFLIRNSHTVSPRMSTKWDQIFTFGIVGAPSEAATGEAFGSACPRNLLPKSLSFSWTNTKYTSFSSASTLVRRFSSLIGRCRRAVV